MTAATADSLFDLAAQAQVELAKEVEDARLRGIASATADLNRKLRQVFGDEAPKASAPTFDLGDGTFLVIDEDVHWRLARRRRCDFDLCEHSVHVRNIHGAGDLEVLETPEEPTYCAKHVPVVLSRVEAALVGVSIRLRRSTDPVEGACLHVAQAVLLLAERIR